MAAARALSAQPGVKTLEEQPSRTPIGADSTVLVIGASRGLGLEFASQCASRGASVYATVRGKSDGILALKEAHGDRLQAVHVDVPHTLDELASVPLGDVTHVIHNAGIVRRSTLETESAADMVDAFRVNAAGVLSVAQLVAPRLRKHRGKLPVYGVLSSKVGSVDDNASGRNYAYRASKTACNIIVKSLAVDLAARVAFVLLHPGWVRTDMTNGRGLIDVNESVAGMLKAVEATDATTPFRWVDYKAELIPW